MTEEKPLFSFGVFADAQYADVTSVGTRYYSSSLSKLEDAYKTFREEEVDFVINLGDLIDRDFNSFSGVLGIIDDSGVKTYHTTGNHDYAVPDEVKEKIPVLGEKNYYSFSRNGFRFIFLDGNEISIYASKNEAEERTARDLLEKMKSSGKKNAMDWNGALSGSQLSWLEKQLEKSESKGEKVIISCHFPVFPDDVHNLLNYDSVLPILQKHKHTVAWFAGHNHSGNYGRHNNVHCLTFRGMVETSASSSYAVIDVFTNRLQVRGFGREENRTLAF